VIVDVLAAWEIEVVEEFPGDHREKWAANI